MVGNCALSRIAVLLILSRRCSLCVSGSVGERYLTSALDVSMGSRLHCSTYVLITQALFNCTLVWMVGLLLGSLHLDYGITAEAAFLIPLLTSV